MKKLNNRHLILTSFLSGAGACCVPLPALAQDAPLDNKALLELLKKQNAQIEKLQADVARLSSEVHGGSQKTDSAATSAPAATAAAGAEPGSQTVARVEIASNKIEPDQGKIPALKIGKANFSLAGSWLEGEMTYRAHNEFASASGSSVNTPFPNQQSYQMREFRTDVRGTRLNMSVFSDPFGDMQQLKGRLQFDWANLANGTTQNNGNFTPRLRQAWLEYDQNRSGWHFVAGQAYSMITPGGNLQAADGSPSADLGWTMMPGTENVFQQLDAFLPGYVGTRQSQVRVVKNLSDKASIGLSLENPEVAWGGTTTGLTTGALTTVATGTGSTGSTLASNGSAGAYSANGYTNTTGLTTWPNVALKGSYQIDPRLLVEGWAMARGYKNVAGITAATNAGTATSGAGGVDAYIKLVPNKVDLSLSTSYGSLGGLDSSGAIPDVTTDNTGKPVPVKELAAWAGLFAYPDKDLTVLGYAGYARGRSAGISGTTSGYGNPNNLNTGCYVANGTCAGNIQRAVSGQLAALWRLYNGPAGRFELQPQITYVQESKFRDAKGVSASASNWVYALAFRYFPF